MRKISRILLGLLFVFSGFVKAVDPVGSSLIFKEYFHAFGIGFLEPFSLICGITLSAVEFTLGVLVLLDFRKRIAAWGVFLFMSFFTILTLFLAIFDPVQDCGCFGDAVKLTNWQTFFKNLFFWPFALFLFLQRNRTAPVARGAAEWPVFIFFALVITSVSVYSYRHLPLIDFRGYKIGNNIAALLEEARLNPEFIFTTELIYNREGEEKVFLPDSLPDSTWAFVDSRTRTTATGVRHKISDFSVRDKSGHSVTDSILAVKATALVLLVASEENLQAKVLAPLELLIAENREKGLPYYAISALPAVVTQELLMEYGIVMPVYMADLKTVLTMIRSTPGLMVIKEGAVLAKYGFRDYPDPETWSKLVNEDPELVVASTSIRNRLRMQLFIAGLLLFIFLLRKGFWFARSRF
ncbi:MAG: DoxX family protein [Bacteroidales bacterium]|jgi:uncharacterized membrane protein YphA (DoxX/SURF4 family)|nr:DoxX family protein [Bacteroidales bacterium]